MSSPPPPQAEAPPTSVAAEHAGGLSAALREFGLARLLLAALAVGLLFALIVASHEYLFRGLVAPLPLPAGLHSLLRGLIFCGAASLVLLPIAERTLPLPWIRWVAWPSALWMGIYFLSFMALVASDVFVWLPLRWMGFDGAFSGWATGRAAVLVALVGVTVVVSLRKGLAPPMLRRVEIELARWPQSLDGYRIVQISDIHIGPILDRRFAAHLAERVNALEPDLVAVTGDLVDGPVSLLRHEVEPFASIRARDGVFFVTGNHDHYSGDAAWAERVGELGWTALRNTSVRIEPRSAPGESFDLAGVDDHRSGMLPGSEGGEDLDAALVGVRPGCPTLLLAHDPSTFKRAHERGIDLQISGHTHGGQIWPFRYFVRAAVPFVSGRYRRGDGELYVSCGTGFWGPPMRLGAPAEITELVLRSPALGSP